MPFPVRRNVSSEGLRLLSGKGSLFRIVVSIETESNGLVEGVIEEERHLEEGVDN